MEKNLMDRLTQAEAAPSKPETAERVSLFSQNEAEKSQRHFSLFGFLADLFTGRGHALETSLHLAALVSFALSPLALIYGLVSLLSRMLTGFSFLRSVHTFAGSLGYAFGFLMLALFLLSAQKALFLLKELKNNQKK